jgi:copper chaperone CopZ
MNQTFTVTNAIHTIDPTAKVTIDRATNKVEVVSTKPSNELAQAIVQKGYTVAN